MHELAIAQSVIEVVEQHAQACQAARVQSVRLQVGEGSGIVADALIFSFSMLTDFSPLLAGASLIIDNVPHRARCQHCKEAFLIKNGIPRCPLCETWSADILSGTELQILEMNIAPPSVEG